MRRMLARSAHTVEPAMLRSHARGLGGEARQAAAEGHRCPLDQEARQEPLRLQEPRQRRPAAQADPALRGDGRGGARQPGPGGGARRCRRLQGRPRTLP
jgi:hypothetical protein